MNIRGNFEVWIFHIVDSVLDYGDLEIGLNVLSIMLWQVMASIDSLV